MQRISVSMAIILSIALTACAQGSTPPPLATATLGRPTRAAPAATSTLAPSVAPVRATTGTAAPTSTPAAASTPVALTQSAGRLPIPKDPPVSSWHNFPIMPNALAGQDNNKGGYYYSIKASPRQIQDFYTGEMKKLGWDLLNADTKANDPGYLSLIYHQANYPTFTVLISVQTDATIVFIAN